MLLVYYILPYLFLDQTMYVESGAPRSIWEQQCKPKSWLLNDCNWCKCLSSGTYQCDDRRCPTVDKSAHFKDAIADITVGMEGHGAWRSTRTACEPGISYRRNGVLCICDEDGNWPNKVCELMYRVLYAVETTGLEVVTGNEACRPNQLYLVGCNVCFCPRRGYLYPDLCTDRICQPDDPVLEGRTAYERNEDTKIYVDREIYAPCQINKEYRLGCRKCICLRNNRLMCNNCTANVTAEKSYCDDHKAGSIFDIKCNSCQCDANKNMYCTAKKCLKNGSKDIMKIINMNHAVKDKYDICAAKKYEKGCSSCKCIKSGNGENIIDCAINCDSKYTIHENCVENTMYELDCQICYCYEKSMAKRQFCVSNPICRTDRVLNETRTRNLLRMHGYCEPLHTYEFDCNVCQCLTDGKTLRCSSKKCDRQASIIIDSMVPVKLRSTDDCPVGHSYQVDCNVCFCLINGNRICTTLDCKDL